MANILDSVRLSGVTYTLAASGGTGGSGVTSGQVETMIRNYTYDKFTIDRKIDNAFDPDEYYTKADIDTKESDLNVRIDELSGKTLTVSGKVSTLEDDVENAYQEIKNVKLELSGAIDTKQDVLVAGDNIIITGNVISAVMSGGSGVTSGQVQMMIDQSISGISGNTNIISGDVKTLSGDVKNISGDVVTISGDVKGLETKIDALSGSVTDILPATDDVFGRGLHIWQMGGSNPGLKTLAEGYDGIIVGRTYGESSTYAGKIRPDWNVIQRKLSAGTGVDITNNVISVTGGGSGSTYTAGRGIDISGDVISFNLPISAGTGVYSVAEGNSSVASGGSSHAEGWLTKANGSQSHAEGWLTVANGNASHAEGYHTEADNYAEHASGQFNISSTASTSFGNDGNTLFGVGNGSASNKKHNALDIRQDGSIYIPNIKASGEYYEKPMILLQDVLSNSGITSGEVQTMITQSISGISGVSGDVKTISGDVVTISGNVSGLEAKIDALSGNVENKQDKLSAGTGIDISNNVISVTGGGESSGITYSAGTGIDITDRVISTTLNAYNGTGSGTLLIGDTRNTASTDFAVAIGVHNEALGVRSLAQGLSGKTTNTGESTFGQLNDTKHKYEGFGHSGNTLFTIGNGAGVDGSTTNYARHNAFEVRSNGDIYIPEPSKVTANHYYQAPMIKLQDRLSEIDNKPNIWCGSESQWSQISGSTQSGTLYLIY